jgi:hypothetical protein
MTKAPTKTGVTVVHVILALALTGCSIFNPYVEPEHPRPGLIRDDKGNIAPSADNRLQATHVTVGEAREYARLLQEAYRRAAADQSKTRNVIDLTAIAAAATAIGIAATGGNAETAGIIGLSAAGLTFAGNRLLVVTRKRIWFRGALALECVINAANSHATPNLAAANLGADLATQNSEIDNLEFAIEDFGRQIERVSKIIPKPDLAAANSAIRKAKTLAKRSHFISDGVIQLMDALNPLGQILLSKVEEIRLRVDAEIAKTEPDLLQYNEALRSLLASSAGGFITPDVAETLIGKEDVGKKGVEYSAAIAPENDIEFQNSFNNLGKAVELLKSANEQLKKTLDEIVEKPVAYPPDIFSNCDLGSRIGGGPLRLSRNKSRVKRGVAVQYEVRISGGRRPYQTVEDTIPEGIDVQLVDDLQSGAIMELRMPAEITRTIASPVVLAVADADGVQRIFMVELVEGETGEGPAEPSESESEAGPKTSTAEMELIRKIQKFLKDEGYDLGPTGIDGQWGLHTRKAICLHFSDADNFADLKSMDEFKTDFEGKTKFPECGGISKDDLIRYISKMF